jgi:hypothetical protein
MIPFGPTRSLSYIYPVLPAIIGERISVESIYVSLIYAGGVYTGIHAT